MSTVETLDQFYKRTNQIIPAELLSLSGNPGHFNVKERSYCSKVSPYNRRDHYKIFLNIGKGRLHMATEIIEVDRPALIFSNPTVPYSWESTSEDQKGYYCLFNDSFISPDMKKGLERICPLFNPVISPCCFFPEDAYPRINGYFLQLIAELKSDYEHKFEVIRNILKLIIHEGIKIQSDVPAPALTNTSDRITLRFMDLLERQFPVDSPANPLKTKRASEFADQLNIHVNHLNYVIKSYTGKTTTQMISNRVVAEAKTLLKQTDWDVAEIGYCLGFDYPAHFNNYFKKNTGLTPAAFKHQS